MAITYKKERFEDIMGELPELFYAHWVELESDKEDVPLEVDWLPAHGTARASPLQVPGLDASRAEGMAAGQLAEGSGLTVAHRALHFIVCVDLCFEHGCT